MKHVFFSFIILLFSLESPAATCNKTIYVKADAIGTEDGSSWKDAYPVLQDALEAAFICNDIQEIWVAQGYYRPTVDISGNLSDAVPQNRTYTVYKDIRIYGGFRGDEGAINERITYLFPSILTGDQKKDDVLTIEPGAPQNAGDNSFNIMRMKNLTSSTIIDGFIFQGGNAVSNSTTLSKKLGGAIFNDGRGINNKSNPIIQNCIFRNNAALLSGGAICNFGDGGNANPSLINCEFRYNAAGFLGGAINNIASGNGFKSDHYYENCIFYKNISSQSGGAITTGVFDNATISDVYLSCTFVDNESPTGGGIYTEADIGQGTIEIIGSIFYSNVANTSASRDFDTNGLEYDVSYSNYSGAPVPEDADGNRGGNPEFSSSENLRLSNTSPLIDLGPLVPGGVQDRDRDNHARVINGRRDMGAYETLLCPANSEIYVNAIQLSSAPDGSTFEKALTTLHEGLLMANTCSEEPNIYLSEGTYYPQEHYHGIFPMEEVRKGFTLSIDRDMNIIGGQDRYNNQSSVAGPSVISGDFNNDDNLILSENLDDNAERIMITKKAFGFTINSFSMKNILFTKFVGKQFGMSLIDISRRATKGIDYKVKLENCIFLDNRYNGNFGLLSIISSVGEGYESDVRLKSCRFQDNIGRPLNIRHFDGVGKVTLDSMEMIENSNNSQQQSGGVYIFASDATSLDVNIDNGLFQGNSSDHDGAALAMRLGVVGHVTIDVDINNCDFVVNQSQRNGGAISFEKSINALSAFGSIKVRNSLFSGNSGKAGGAIEISDIGSNVDVNIANNIFHSNRSKGFSSSDGGAAVAMTGVGLSKITNCTFYQNIADTQGGAISLGGITNAQIVNSAFWLNRSMQGLEVNSIYKSSAFPSTTMTHSLTELSICPNNVEACTSMIFDQNPMMNIDSEDQIFNFVPFANSPLIDAGNTELAPNEIYDFTGSRFSHFFGSPGYRIRNNTVDIGAQEYQGICEWNVTLNPMDPIFAIDNGNIRGAWAAENKITVLPGFTTSDLNHLVLDADEVEFINDYSFMSSKQLQIINEGCTSN